MEIKRETEKLNECLLEMGLRGFSWARIRSKAGISVYRVKTEESSYVLKMFEHREDTREIENYRILSRLQILTLPLLQSTEKAILLPDIGVSQVYRLGEEKDLCDPQVAKVLAGWYRELHEKGRGFLKESCLSLYDELELLTLENLRMAAVKTVTEQEELWQELIENFDLLQKKLSNLPRTLTYNDFYYTNLVVAKDGSRAFPFDYNLMGKGMAYSDIRNVTSSLSTEAAEAFREAYNMDGLDEEKAADEVFSPVVCLIAACRQDKFPAWAGSSLKELKSGALLRKTRDWLHSKPNGGSGA